MKLFADAPVLAAMQARKLLRPIQRVRPARLLPVSPALLRVAGQLTGKSAEVERLLDSLVIDSSKIRRELGWGAAVYDGAGVGGGSGLVSGERGSLLKATESGLSPMSMAILGNH